MNNIKNTFLSDIGAEDNNFEDIRTIILNPENGSYITACLFCGLQTKNCKNNHRDNPTPLEQAAKDYCDFSTSIKQSGKTQQQKEEPVISLTDNFSKNCLEIWCKSFWLWVIT